MWLIGVLGVIDEFSDKKARRAVASVRAREAQSVDRLAMLRSVAAFGPLVLAEASL